jgi:hypothetical protein
LPARTQLGQMEEEIVDLPPIEAHPAQIPRRATPTAARLDQAAPTVDESKPLFLEPRAVSTPAVENIAASFSHIVSEVRPAVPEEPAREPAFSPVTGADPPAGKRERAAYDFPAFAPGLSVRIPKALRPADQSLVPSTAATKRPFAEPSTIVAAPAPGVEPVAQASPVAARTAPSALPAPAATQRPFVRNVARASAISAQSSSVPADETTQVEPVQAINATPPVPHVELVPQATPMEARPLRSAPPLPQAPQPPAAPVPPLAAPTPSVIPAAPAERRARIQIGRLDLQVINQPPLMPAPRPQKTPAANPGEYLEPRFLERSRFRL